MKRSKILLLLIMVGLTAASASAQCSMCKAAVETDTDSGGGLMGINHGILYLLAVPYILLMLFFRKKIGGFFRELRGLWK